jgi:hypothetical protein
MATIGSLVVSLEANMASFEASMNRATRVAESSMDKVKKSLETAKHAIEALAAAFAIEKFAEFIKGGIESAASLNKLSAQTGITVETLSALRNIARMSGTDFALVAGSVDKLSKNMVEAASGGAPKAAAALRALGVSAKDAAGNFKEPGAMLQEIAQKLMTFQDGVAKNAVEMELFGRSGAEMAEFLKDLAAAGKLNATVTTEQSEQAEIFERRLIALGIQWDSVKRTVALGVIPAFTAVLDAFKKVGNNAAAQSGIITALGVVFKSFAYVVLGVASSVDLFVRILGMGYTVMQDIVSGKPSIDKLKSQWADAKSAAQAYRTAEDSIFSNAALSSSTSNNNGRGHNSPRKNLNFTILTPKSSRDDPLKAILDQQLKTIESAIKSADLAWQNGNKQLDDLYKRNLISLADFGAQKIKLLEDNFSLSQSLYDSEIAAIQRMVQVETDAKHREQMLAQLSEVQGKKEQDALKFTQEKLQLTDQLRQASEDYARALMDLDIQYALLNNDTLTATKLQQVQSDAMLRARLTIEGNTEALAKLDAIEQDALLRATNTAGAGIERAAKDYSKQISNIGKSFEDMTGKMMKGIEDAFVEFARTGKLSFKSLIDSIIADLLRLATQEYLMKPLTQIIFGSGVGVGGGGGLGGIFGMAMNWLGGMGGGGIGLTNAQTAGAFAGIGADAAAAMPHFASGGYLGPGQWGIAGENGAERIYGGRTGVTVRPAEKQGGGMTSVTNHFVIQAPQGSVSRATQQQIAAAAAKGVAIAGARNN